MKNLNRRIAVFLAVVMFFLAPTADITVMAEEVSDTAVTENESYQMEKSDIEESTEVDSEQTESQIEQQSEDQMISHILHHLIYKRLLFRMAMVQNLSQKQKSCIEKMMEQLLKIGCPPDRKNCFCSNTRFLMGKKVHIH